MKEEDDDKKEENVQNFTIDNETGQNFKYCSLQHSIKRGLYLQQHAHF